MEKKLILKKNFKWLVETHEGWTYNLKIFKKVERNPPVYLEKILKDKEERTYGGCFYYTRKIKSIF
jgi:hypothetical protein